MEFEECAGNSHFLLSGSHIVSRLTFVVRMQYYLVFGSH